MKTIEDYLNMQKSQYEYDAAQWSLDNRNPVVGSYDQHNSWEDYDVVLFRNIDTKQMTALEYGCGPARNIIKFSNRFKKIDGVDIAAGNLEKAKINLQKHNIANYDLFQCDGKSIPAKDEIYDLVFSVICLQHIASYSIRYSIFNEVFRVLNKGGYFCFQMGFGGKKNIPTTDYYSNDYHAQATNGAHDVSVTDPSQLQKDLMEIGFSVFEHEIREVGPGDNHKNWIWVRVKK